jgi:hypothetical protein
VTHGKLANVTATLAALLPENVSAVNANVTSAELVQLALITSVATVKFTATPNPCLSRMSAEFALETELLA